MIVREIIEVNGTRMERTYSDAGFLIRKVGTAEIYGEAIDPENSGRVYEETEIEGDGNDS